jgi:hypothetical protein
MVRSSGNEDGENFANAGGNSSYAAQRTLQDITEKWINVVAEFFGPRSLSQHAAANQSFPEKVHCAVVVQELIADSEVVSGVMHVYQDGSIVINAAPSHGELVVNSLGFTDVTRVTPQGVIFNETKKKDLTVEQILKKVN